MLYPTRITRRLPIMSDARADGHTSGSTLSSVDSGSASKGGRIIPPGASAAGWLAFEDRVIQRRAQARLEAARTAIGEGRFADAATALEEVRALIGDPPEVTQVVAALEAAQTVDAVGAARQAETRRYNVRLAGATALLLFGLMASRTSDWLRPQLDSYPPAVGTAVLPPTPAVPTLAAFPPTPAAPDGTLGTAGETESIPTTTSEAIGADTTAPAAPRTDVADRRTPSERRTVPAPTPTVPAGRQTQPVAAVEAPPEFVPPATPASGRRDVEQVASAVMRSALPGTAPAVTPDAALAHTGSAMTANAALAHTGSAETEIRRALQQYRHAYASLDAQAAVEVWPSLDVRALARAFNGLSAQTLVFDRCDVSVRGAQAIADCAGQASYVRKVGNRDPQTEPRQWRFQLAQADGAWRIASVEARR